MECAVLLSGEHPSLPAAELHALLAVHDPRAKVRMLAPRVAAVTPGAAGGTDAALVRMALAHEWGTLWEQVPDDEEGLAELAFDVLRRADGKGTAAVEAVRAGGAGPLHRMAVERRLGRALQDAGHRIDLAAPQRPFSAWLTDGRLILVERHRQAQRGRGRFEDRILERRAHFMPVGLHPRRAASLIHLARVPPGGSLYDPFCGTGGILLEAALDGYRALGSDVDPVMVQGTLQTLADAGPEPLHGEAFVADIGAAPELVGPVDGIVTDLPYGGASSTRHEPVEELYARAFAAFVRVLRPEGRAVVGLARPDLLGQARAAGLQVEEVHEERMHRSLTRRFAVVKRPRWVGR